MLLQKCSRNSPKSILELYNHKTLVWNLDIGLGTLPKWLETVFACSAFNKGYWKKILT